MISASHQRAVAFGHRAERFRDRRAPDAEAVEVPLHPLEKDALLLVGVLVVAVANLLLSLGVELPGQIRVTAITAGSAGARAQGRLMRAPRGSGMGAAIAALLVVPAGAEASFLAPASRVDSVEARTTTRPSWSYVFTARSSPSST